jgi:manganese efflux pump family protein
MTPFSIALLSLSMSADAFAASLGRGASVRPNFAGAVRGGLVFGIVEAITPLLGWAVGLATASFVGAVDHWIAFALLAAVGGKMIYEASQAKEEGAATPGRGIVALVAVAIGTSIDAAAVGVTLALIGANILVIALSIGFATFAMTTMGMMIGRAAGAKFGSIVEAIGGLMLIGIGTAILVEHLELLA